MIIYKQLVLIVGGRNNKNESLSLDILNLSYLRWSKLPGINRFRHGSWSNSGFLYIFGGFESNQPDTPTNELLQANILDLLTPLPTLKKQIIDLGKSGSSKLADSLHQSMFNKYDLNPNVVVARIESKKNPSMIHIFPLHSLQKEADKLKSK